MKKLFFTLLFCSQVVSSSDNQTNDISPVLVGQKLPFNISIELTNLRVPGGIQSGANGQCGSDYLFIAGRTNGLHGFADGNNDFPPRLQNSTIFVINPCTQTVKWRSLYDPQSGLTQQQIDTLTVTSPQSYQSNNTLYMTGGYGVETDSGNFSTKPILTAIDVPGLIHWVTNPSCGSCASDYIRQISNPIFQVTGGYMAQYGQEPTLLIFGQNFIGFYTTGTNGIYTRQVRKFDIIDDGNYLGVLVKDSTPINPSYRRRDLNVIPIIKTDCKKKTPAYVALSGVFTLGTGIWTVPVEITSDGTPTMANPSLESTFKQGMNNYASAHVELLSKNGDMYSVLFGGITYGFFQNGQFMTDTGFPFTNQVTAIRRSPNGKYQQYLLPVEYPTIKSTFSNPGNTLLFGAGATFVPAPNIPQFANGVLNLAKIKRRTVIGYIIGGIQSTVPNTSSNSDTAASPYIFKVTLTPCS